ncbi:MAG TPA: GNAT family N-acetyltransferase [Methylomirabilota bacterium]|nr:GNAT family N-acetyltransferase [Methylomirabilota bacterium]
MSLDLRDARGTAGDRQWLANVYPFYLHDLSEFDDGYYRLDERGLWLPDHLPSWLEEDDDQPLIIIESGRRVGFALVNRAPSRHVGPGMDFRMAEFFVLRAHRRQGVGRRAVLALFERFRGRWEIFQLPRNAAAIAFWRRVIGAYSGGRFEETADGSGVRQVVDTRR